MADVRAKPWNGLTVASTFCGGGGSSLGYRMAGYRIAWASEFIQAARDTYLANASPRTIMDPRDIRDVQAADVLAATGLSVGALDILDGSPPCSSFSKAGARQKHWGTEKTYSDKTQRTDDLFGEFARLVDGLRPRVFVAENVGALVRGAAKGIFLDILGALKAPGYQVSARLCDAQWLGVPQVRERLIIVGVRDDLGIAPHFPHPLSYRYSVRDAIPWIDQPGAQPVEPETDIAPFAIAGEWDRINPGERSSRYFQLKKPPLDGPCQTITAGAPGGGDQKVRSLATVVHPLERRKFSTTELKRLCGFPDDCVLTGSYAERWERLGRAVPPPMMAHIAATIRDRILIPVPTAAESQAA